MSLRRPLEVRAFAGAGRRRPRSDWVAGTLLFGFILAAPTVRAAPLAPAGSTPAKTKPAASSVPPPKTPPPKTRVETERDLVTDDHYVVHLSMPTESDRKAWMEPGLRVDLALDGGRLWGRATAPPLTTIGAQVRSRYRLDRRWSVFAALRYAVVRGSWTGAAWSAIVGPLFHPLPQMGISLGVGYGGLDVHPANGTGFAPPGNTDSISRTLGDNETMFACAGGAWVSQASLEYLVVVGPLFETGPYLRADLQWTGCEETFQNTDLETGLPAVGRQWWLDRGADVGWWFAWR